MIASLKALGDFVVELKWDFTSWVPLVSKMLPSDVCKITKKGKILFIISRIAGRRSFLCLQAPLSGWTPPWSISTR
jgi:hypothetical protein